MGLNKQSIRIAAGAAAAALLAVTIIPSLFRFSSNDGVVNGRIIILRSPLSGVLRFERPIQYGTCFKSGETMAKVVNHKADDSALHALKTEKSTLEGRIVALQAKTDELNELGKTLKTNLDIYKDSLKRKINADIKQAEQRLEQEKAENMRAKSELDAHDSLNKQMITPKIENDKYVASFAKSSARLQEIEWNLTSLRTVIEALGKDSFLVDSGNNDAPYSKQRMDQLVVETSLAKSVIEEAKARLNGIDSQIAQEELRLAKFSTADIKATSDCIVWRMPASDGEVVAENNEVFVLLDCSSIFLDVSVSETQFANIRSGDKISYKLLGASHSHVGTVIALRGSGSVLGDINLAAELNKNPRRDFRVWIKVAGDDLDLSPENFYQVGRRVEAKIPRKWNLKDNLLKFLDVF